VGLQTRPAKSDTAKRDEPYKVRSSTGSRGSTVRRKRVGAGRYAHAAIGRRSAGNNYRGRGFHNGGTAHPCGTIGADIAGAPHRGQNCPSNIVPQQAHCISASRGPAIFNAAGTMFEGQFCPRCGAPAISAPIVPQGWPCPRCGTLFLGNYCPRCGLPIAAWRTDPHRPSPADGRSSRSCGRSHL